jgi:hypothetical protein
MNLQTPADLIVATTGLLCGGRPYVVRTTRSQRGLSNSTMLTTAVRRRAPDIADVQSTIPHACPHPAEPTVAIRPVYKVQ